MDGKQTGARVVGFASLGHFFMAGPKRPIIFGFFFLRPEQQRQKRARIPTEMLGNTLRSILWPINANVVIIDISGDRNYCISG